MIELHDVCWQFEGFDAGTEGHEEEVIIREVHGLYTDPVYTYQQVESRLRLAG